MGIKDAANRRKSIAVSSHRTGSIAQKGRRRAHSAVPSELSPFARSRLSTGPAKGILKASSLRSSLQDDSRAESHLTGQGSSQLQAGLPSSAPDADDSNATQSMDITQDFQTRIHDNFTRKSMGRRVSFSEHAYVRVFEKNTDNTNSTGSPQSSPGTPSSENDVLPAPVNNENDYPGAFRRRSSLRQSFASEGSDMDLTTIDGASALLDEDSDNFDDDMEITEVLNGNILRKRSMSTAERKPLSDKHPHSIPDSDDADSFSEEQSMSFSEDLSLSDAGHTQPMEFTIPLAQALRPANEDPVWLELQKATHAGTSSVPYTEDDDDVTDPLGMGGTEEMEIDDALERLQRARESIGINIGGDSFSSVESEDNIDDDNRTMNFSKLFGRPSAMFMDENEISAQGSPAAEPQLTPSIYPSIPSPIQSQPTLTVFHPPTEPTSSITNPTISRQVNTLSASKPSIFSSSSVTNVPSPLKSSPSKLGPKTFTAAFAPPVARASPKQPAKSPQSSKRTLSQRSNDENLEDSPSPAKRLTVTSHRLVHDNDPPSASSATPTPRPLSPSKKARFENIGPKDSTQKKPTAKRPSGYFARRRSIATGLASTPSDVEPAPAVIRMFPQKKAGLGLGRASMGSGPTDAWKRFNRDAGSGPASQGTEIAEKDPEVPVQRSTPQYSSPDRSAPPQTSSSPSPSPPSPIVDDDLFPILDPLSPENREVRMDVDLQATQSTEQWRQDVEPDLDEDEGPPISIQQFFEMTNIKFMDDLTAPRRSVHPSQLASRQPRNPADIRQAEYTIAVAIDIPQLLLYSRVSSDLQAWMQQSKGVFIEAEEEAAKMTPELFIEFSRADEEGQAELLHQLNLIRTNTRAQAKSDWYEWKLQWIEGLRVTAEQALSELETDAKTLADLRAHADDIVPALQQEYDSIMQELQQEQAEVAEIEQCDQEYLNELKASIAEQNLEVDALKNEVSEGNEQLKWLGERLEEIELQRHQANTAISEANRILHMQTHSTEAEVFRLRNELEALEDMHMLHVAKVNSQLFEYVYASQFRVSIPCVNFLPIVQEVEVQMLDTVRFKYKDDFPRLRKFLVSAANHLVHNTDVVTTRQIVHLLRDYWSSCSQLRLQMSYISIKFPVDIATSTSENPSFTAVVKMMFPSKKAKVLISFHFDFGVFSKWPCSVAYIQYGVEVAYGSIDPSPISTAVAQRLREVTPADSYACLLDACIDAYEACR
ncbi:Spc7 kinetochore protein-domain-containing protein [Armillaria novae-zelandiae]|uniref:Spc7 kinetochore protein-domain-containing protein n=1 Tax=Armillaria novae-zelandiae TaxID=153914 RepID=A0AA39PCU0_9AGAR|nr:Spc7 kinetochore protein-domain-containing protein [Armillaria novae-zelandiae]